MTSVLLEAVPHVAERWRDYVKDYVLDEDAAEWRHKDDRPFQSELHLRIPEVLERLSTASPGGVYRPRREDRQEAPEEL